MVVKSKDYQSKSRCLSGGIDGYSNPLTALVLPRLDRASEAPTERLARPGHQSRHLTPHLTDVAALCLTSIFDFPGKDSLPTS